MRKKFIFHRIGMICILLAFSFVAGCAKKAEGRLDRLRDIAYRVPRDVPHILTDQIGYRTGEEKMVFVSATDPDEAFEVRSLTDDSVLFTGKLRQSQSGELSAAVFTDFQTDGTYYIYNKTVGSSYAFRIGADIGEHLAQETLQNFTSRRCGQEFSGDSETEDEEAPQEKKDRSRGRKDCHVEDGKLREDPNQTRNVSGGWHTDKNGNRDVVKACHAVRDLLLAYELDPDSFGDDMGIPESGNGIPDLLDEVKFEIDWLSKMQVQDGSVYASCESGKGEQENLVAIDAATPEATIAFSQAMSRFAWLYREFDSPFAAECQKKAQSAWTAYIGKKHAAQDRAAFAAAADLYRMTGDKKYENVLSVFFHNEEQMGMVMTDEDLFFGGVTYLMTAKQPINRAVCDQLMETLLQRGEKIAEIANHSPYRVSGEGREAIPEMLNNMRTLTVLNHIIYNHEYTSMITDHLHYFCGRNQDNVNFASREGECSYLQAGYPGIPDDLDNSAKLLIMQGMID